jgi:hypothetical protein
MQQRYAGRPFLRLLECYVLWAAGVLPAADEQRLEAMTPKLRGREKGTSLILASWRTDNQ